MKKTRKIFAVVLALVMCFAMALPAMAAPNPAKDHTLTITSKEGDDVYEAYQIFKGKEYNKTLSDVEWGDNIDTSKVADLLSKLQNTAVFGDTFARVENAADVAQALGNVVSNAEMAQAFADVINGCLKATEAKSGAADGPDTQGKFTYEISGLADGYYLVKDQAGSVKGDQAYTDFILQVVANATVEAKSEVPTVDKSITGEEENDGNDTGNADADELSIGDTVVYTLSSTVPARATDYTKYFFVFRDTLSKGLDFTDGSVVVKAEGNEQPLVEETDYTLKVTKGTENTSIVVALIDAIAHAGKKITVEYKAVLNEHAVIGNVGNPNDVDLLFSNNPNYDYKGTPGTDTDNDGIPDVTDNEVFGITPKDTVQTFTTGLAIQKVDENGDVLKGAEFNIKGEHLNMTLVYTDKFEEAAEGGEYYKLKDGTYTNEEPRTADQMIEKAKDKRNNGYIETTDKTRDGYIEVGGKGYAPANKQERESEVTLYALQKRNDTEYESTTVKYTKTPSYEVKKSNNNSVDVKAFVGEDGVVRFDGLGAGDYTITETTTPDGYNTIDEIHVTIGWKAPTKIGGQCEWTVSGKGFTVDPNGVITVTIENQSGSLLPGTGGIGTTIFYIVGICIVVAAGVILVTRKRISKNN